MSQMFLLFEVPSLLKETRVLFVSGQTVFLGRARSLGFPAFMDILWISRIPNIIRISLVLEIQVILMFIFCSLNSQDVYSPCDFWNPWGHFSVPSVVSIPVVSH